jgi:hypothetical protein
MYTVNNMEDYLPPKQLADILRMLAQLVMSREKNAYLSTTSALTIDGGKDKGRGR